MLASDTSYNYSTNWKYGYSVRELRNLKEGEGGIVSCCGYYWQHLEYLDDSKAREKLIVWLSMDLNWTEKSKRRDNLGLPITIK